MKRRDRGSERKLGAQGGGGVRQQQRRDCSPCCCRHSRAAVPLPIIHGRMLICRPQVAGIKNSGGCSMGIIFFSSFWNK